MQATTVTAFHFPSGYEGNVQAAPEPKSSWWGSAGSVMSSLWNTARSRMTPENYQVAKNATLTVLGDTVRTNAPILTAVACYYCPPLALAAAGMAVRPAVENLDVEHTKNAAKAVGEITGSFTGGFAVGVSQALPVRAQNAVIETLQTVASTAENVQAVSANIKAGSAVLAGDQAQGVNGGDSMWGRLKSAAEIVETKVQSMKDTKGLMLKGAGCLFGAITLYFGSKFIWNKLDRYFNRPKLDYKLTPFDLGKRNSQQAQPAMIFSQVTADSLQKIVESTKTINKRIAEGDVKATYRNLLLFGPIGSGKHLFAKKLAQTAGMDFIEVSASSLSNADAAGAIKDFFQGVARNATEGTVIFINNAAPLVSCHKAKGFTPLSKKTIDAFLEQTDKANNKFMIIFSLAEKPALSAEMASVAHDIVEFTKPEIEQRIKILEVHRDTLFSGDDIIPEHKESALQLLTQDKMYEIAEKLEGLSAAALAEVMQQIKVSACGKELLSNEEIDRIVQNKVDKQKTIVS